MSDDREISSKDFDFGRRKSLNELRDEAFACSTSHGFYEDGEPNFGMRLALIHSEVSEALEDFRSGKRVGEIWYLTPKGEKTPYGARSEGGQVVLHKPCGIPSELADVIIRVLDLAGANGIDIEKAVLEKMAYNMTRPHKHGRKC